MIEHVRQQLAEKYSNYELVITEVHDFIRPSLQEPMYMMLEQYQFLII